MKRPLTTAVLVIVAGAGAYAYWGREAASAKASVTQSAIRQGSLVQTVQATGTLDAVRTVAVGSQVSGTVSQLNADFNSIVRKDEVIAQLDPALLEVQVEVQKAAIGGQQSDIDNARVQLENDQLTLTRTRAQFEKGLLSQQQLEAAELQVKNRQASITSLEKQLVQAQASLHQAELNVSYTTIRSPIDGVVVDRTVDVGQTVQASMTTPQFFTIAADLTQLKLTAGVDEADIGLMRPGMPVTFTVDAYGTKPFRGTVDSVRLNAQTQNNVVTYPVTILVHNDGLELRPSMTANVKIVVDQAEDVVQVPNQALRFRPTADTYTWLGLPAPPASARPRPASTSSDATIINAPATERPAPAASGPAAKIDNLFQPLPPRVQTGQVWLWDEHEPEASKRLRAVSVRLGLTDGQFTELISASEPIGPGAMVVTGVVPPASALPKAAATSNNVFNQNQRGGPGGFGPGGGFGPPRGGG
jgi:HlyD family secretion protein